MKDEVKAAVLAAEQRWVDAHLNLDLDTIESMLSDDYRQIQSNGNLIGKEELLRSYRSGKRDWTLAHSDELEVHIHGQVAWLTGRWHGKGENSGVPFDYQARFLAIYRLEAGRWNLAADVSLPLKPPE